MGKMRGSLVLILACFVGLVVATSSSLPLSVSMTNSTEAEQRNRQELDSLVRGSGAGGAGGRGAEARRLRRFEWLAQRHSDPDSTPEDLVEECVEAIRTAKTTPQIDTGFVYRYSFPPPGFLPMGAESWCECLIGKLGSELPLDVYYDVPESLATKIEGSFDMCFDSVLKDSEFNVVDICRGMQIFRELDFYNLEAQGLSFCARLCKDDRLEGVYPDYIHFGLANGCQDMCAKMMMPGYCSKYLVTYSSWFVDNGYYQDKDQRSIAVGMELIGLQDRADYIFFQRRDRAERLCSAIADEVGGADGCCSYERAFEALKICCAEEGGKAKFDCAKNYGGKNLLYDCQTRYVNAKLAATAALTRPEELIDSPCYKLIKAYEMDVSYGSAWLFMKPSGMVQVMFEKKLLMSVFGDDFCSEDNYVMDLLANCSDASSLTYVGPAVPPLTDILPPGDPCYGLCSRRDEYCHVTTSGLAFCVQCKAPVKRFPDMEGTITECCSFDFELSQCRSRLKDRSPGICRQSDEIFYFNKDFELTPFKAVGRAEYICHNPWYMRQNGLACRIKRKAGGEYVCQY